MGDPLTIASAAGLGASLLGGALKGSAEQRQLEAKRQADLQNQQLANAQAADALRRGAFQAGQVRQRGDQIIGQERTGYAASGVDENVGTAAAVQGETAARAELDAQTAQNNAARQAWGYKVSATQEGQQAALDEQAKSEVGTETLLGGLGQGAMGAAGIYDAFKRRQGQ